MMVNERDSKSFFKKEKGHEVSQEEIQLEINQNLSDTFKKKLELGPCQGNENTRNRYEKKPKQVIYLKVDNIVGHSQLFQEMGWLQNKFKQYVTKKK